MKDQATEKIAKVIARSGFCSRRDAEKLILQGKVSVNKSIISSPAIRLKPSDTIEIDNKSLEKKKETRLWIFNKPSGFITTHKDEQNRKTIFDILPKTMPRVISIGRLDLNSEGLILLTNDGELSRFLEHPSNGWQRTYKVRAFGNIDENLLNTLRKGTIVDSIKYLPIKIEVLKQKSDSKNKWFNITLKEGKNREIKILLKSIGLNVNRLIRVSYGPFKLGNVETGKTLEISNNYLKNILKNKYNV